MDLSDARQRLVGTTRHELRDHAFGDREVTWVKNGTLIASGYFGGGAGHVSFHAASISFVDNEARSLLDCGTLEVSRNDETGPDEFTEGDVMPGLSKGDVYHELTGEYLDEKEE